MGSEKRPATTFHAVVARISRGLDFLQYALIAVVVVILAVSTVLLLWQVFDRLVLGGGQNWIEEYARLSLVWLTFLGAAALLRERRHLAVGYFVEKFPARVQSVFAIGIDLALTVLLLGLLTQVPAVWASSSVLVSPSLGIPRTVLALAAFVSFGVGAIYCLESIMRRLAGLGPAKRLTAEPAQS